MSGKRNWGDNMTNRMDGKVYPVPNDDVVLPIPSKVWKLKYQCKKNKGDHTFEIDSIHTHGWHQHDNGTWEQSKWYWGKTDRPCYWVEWRCTACKKKKMEWDVPKKSFDKYRHTIAESYKGSTPVFDTGNLGPIPSSATD